MSNVNEPMITLSELEILFEELNRRKHTSTEIMRYDGTRLITDVGYAWDGVEWVFEEIKHKIKKEVEE